EQDQGQQQEAERQAKMGKERIAGSPEQGAEAETFGQSRRLLQHLPMRLAQAQPDDADHGESKGVAAPPNAEGVEGILSADVRHSHTGQQRRRKRGDGAYGPKPG